MRVAVVFPAERPENGGEHTFQQTLAHAIRAHADANTSGARHEFVFFEDDENTFRPSSAAERQLGFETVRVPASRPARVVRKAAFLVNRVQELLLDARPVNVETTFGTLLRRHGIEFVWFATPHFFECSLPYLATIFDLQHQNQPWFPEVGEPNRWAIRESVTRRAVTKAAAVIVANGQAERELLRAYPIASERVLKLGHPTPQFALRAAQSPMLPYPAHLGVQGEYVLYPAQFWAHKNHVTLLKAVRRLRDQGSSLELVFVGADKNNRSHVENMVERLGLQTSTHILGFVSQSDLVALYQHARVLAYPSMFGPENLPPLEAFALGCPVVCANYAGASEQLEDAAVLVDALDVEAWSSALTRVSSDEAERAVLVARGKRRASELSAARYVSAVMNFLDRFALVRENWR